MRLLILSSMYDGYLDSFHKKAAHLKELNYSQLWGLLLSESTEFVSSYVRAFNESGIEASAVILNDNILQDKWKKQYGSDKDGEELLSDQIMYYKPDVLWIDDLRFTGRSFLKDVKTKCGIKLLVAYHCAPWNSGTISKLKEFDFIITCTPGLKNDFDEEGLKAFLVYHGFDSSIPGKIGNVKSNGYQVIFSGSLKQGAGYHRARIDLVEYLVKKGINISLFITVESTLTLFAKKVLRLCYVVLKFLGIDTPEKILNALNYGKVPVKSYPEVIMKNKKAAQFGLDMYRLLKSSKIVLNNHGEIAGGYAGNMRLFEATGVGSCLLTDNKDNLVDLFEIGREIMVYDSPEDCAAKISWFLEHDEERERIALAGQRKTLSCHTVQNRCRQILEIINSEINPTQPLCPSQTLPIVGRGLNQ